MQFCGTPLFDVNLWNHERYPDVSPCFQQLFFYIFPSLFLMITSTCRLYHLYQSKKAGHAHHWLASVQTIVSACLVVPPLADMLRTIHDMNMGHMTYPIYYLSAMFRVLAMILSAVIIQAERKRCGRYFGGLFGYWSLLTMAGMFIVYSKVRTALMQGFIEDHFRLATFTVHYLLVLIQFVLTFFPNPYVIVNEKSSPELKACFASRLTFWWFNELIVRGYKQPLEDKDLYELNDVDKAGAWVPGFENHWNRETNRLIRLSAQKTKSTDPSEGTAHELEDVSGQKSDQDKQTSEEECLLSKKLPEGVRPSLVKCLAKVFLPSILICASFKLVHDALVFVQPLLLREVIRFVEESSQPSWRGYIYAIIMFTSAVLQTFFLHQYFHKATLIGMRLRSTICAAVYNKALKLTSGSRKESTVGEIVNLMSVDAQRFMDIMTYLNTIWSAPLQILVSLALLWGILGPSVLAGFAIMILMIPLNVLVGNKIKKLQVTQMKEKDKRIKLMSEILNGIKVLKLYAWEQSFSRIIGQIRQKELDLLKKAGYINAFSTFVWQCAPFFVSCASFAVYVVSGKDHVLDAEKAFVALSLFNIMRFPMSMLPNIVTSMIQTSVSVSRISKFLSLQELNPNQIGSSARKGDAIALDQCSFTWKAGSGETPTLNNISVNIKHGQLVAIVGVVGSGKSSLLSGLLGDMCKVKGKACVDGSVAYVAQQAWIQNATLRDNILFGGEFDEHWYNRVVEACALLPDLDVLPAGDLTEIGEKGINLSGGQKQRVSLARAVYSKADIYYLDDPLSAVDAHVGRHIFDKVISHSGLLKGKTRLLVTHGINFLPDVDDILVVKNGSLSEQGSFQQLLNLKGDFADFLSTYFVEEKKHLEETGTEGDAELLKQVNAAIESDDLGAFVRGRLNSIGSMHSHVRDVTQSGGEADGRSLKSARSTLTVNEIRPAVSMEIIGQDMAGEQFGSTAMFNEPEAVNSGKTCECSAGKGETVEDKLIQAEKSEQGRVKLSVFRSYLSSMGWLPAVLVLVFFMADQGCVMAANVWLGIWSDDTNAFNVTASRNMYLGVYTTFGVMQGVFALAAMFALTIGCWVASRRLHHHLLANIIHCPSTFFDTTPTGRILNRFSKDIDVVDMTIPVNGRSFIWCLMTVLGTIIIIAYSTPWFLVVAVPLAVIYILIQRFYVATTRQLKRLESVNLSPIYSHFDESVLGAATIRAFRRQDIFMIESLKRVDKHQQAYYPIIISNRWLAVRLEFIGSCIVLSAVMLAVISRNVGSATLTAGIAGLSISYALNVTNTLNWLVRMTSELENNVVAVERIKEYSEVPQEADWIIDINRPAKDWPSVGTIQFDGYSVRYRDDLDLALKSISCTINGGEKVGICGRTGAGKSTLTLALFRILEGAQGAIYIDDVHIGAIGLHDLRNALTIIPQDPVVFSGSLRLNLDPFHQYTDDNIWQVLEQVNLKSFVKSLSEGLEYECSEGGSNLSVGQRQLICLGRALLRHTKILILDEATAAVDLETDDLIQATIRSAFSDCTVLTIAHRLNTIIDYDRIMVLDAGEIKEFSPPQQLLANEESIFYSLAKQANLV